MYSNGMKFIRDGVQRREQAQHAELMIRMRDLIAEQGFENRTPITQGTPTIVYYERKKS